MKQLLRVLLPLVFMVSMLGAQSKPSVSTPATGLPPLIDRELIFGNSEITAPQIPPDGKYLAFIKPWKETRNIWVKKTEEPFANAKLLTTEKQRPIQNLFWRG